MSVSYCVSVSMLGIPNPEDGEERPHDVLRDVAADNGCKRITVERDAADCHAEAEQPQRADLALWRGVRQ